MGHSRGTVLVTGAEGALGSGVVDRFLASGATVIATYLAAPSAHWRPSDRLIPVRMDVGDPGSVRAGFKSLADRPVDRWIHCAGGFRFASVENVTDEDLDFLLNVNVRSAFLLARELLPGMRRRNFGRIVFVGARVTLQPGAGMGPYAASKAALNMLTLALADEVRASNITVNAVLPSIIDTPANRRDMPGADFSTWVRLESLAEILHSLTEPLGDPIHGALIPVAGRL